MLDRAALLERLGGNEDLLAEIGRLFHESCAPLQEELREALRRGEASRLSRTAHTLKGMLSNLSAAAAARAALRLEGLAQQGDLGGANEALRALEVELGRVREWVPRLLAGPAPGSEAQPPAQGQEVTP